MAKDLSTMAKNNKSYMAKPGEVESKWYVVDATDMVLGRLASQVASILKGKNKPEYTPNVDCGDHVIIINCEKVVLTGKKLEDKYYRYHTGYIGGLKEIQYKKLMAEKCTRQSRACSPRTPSAQKCSKSSAFTSVQSMTIRHNAPLSSNSTDREVKYGY